ncbi:MAG: GNAT family N-acetyltransferase, partial [Stellaceae bacterium]
MSGVHRDLHWLAEEAELNAYPPVRQALLGGWVLRFSEGGARRGGNSATPIRPDCDDGGDFIAAAEALYRGRGSVPLFRVPTIVTSAIVQRLTARGYTREGESCTIYGPMRGIADEPDPQVRLLPAPTPRWFAAMARLQGRTPVQAAVYRRIVRNIAVPAAFALLAADGEPAALAYATLHRGLLCYESVIADPHRRRQGFAWRVIATLADWGRAAGADAACLQVEAGNAPARVLY